MSEPRYAGFDDRVGDYARRRPGYPAEAFAAMTADLDPCRRAIDVGCGTGLATRGLATVLGPGGDVLGVDPSEAMLETARATAAEGDATIRFAVGRGEALPVEDGAADLVLVAQAFHWLDADRALPELRRVLRPGGRLVLMWNVHDETDDPATRAYRDVVRRAQEDAATRGLLVPRERRADPTPGGHFALEGRLRRPNPHRLDRDGLVGRLRSASYCPPAGPVLEDCLARLAALHDAHAGPDGHVVLDQWTELTFARRD